MNIVSLIFSGIALLTSFFYHPAQGQMLFGTALPYDTGTKGRIVIQPNAAGFQSILDASSTNANRVYYFPNLTGTVALTSSLSPATSTNPLIATYFVATSTTIASQFPFASTTSWSITSTSTGTKGINLTGGCFAVNGTCLSITGSSGDTLLAQNTNVSQTTTASATTTLYSVTIPANTLGATSKSLRATGLWATAGGSSACKPDIEFGNGSASTTIGFMSSNTYGGMLEQMTAIIYATSTASQASFTVATGIDPTQGNQRTPPGMGWGAYSTFDLTAKTYIGFALKADTATCQFIGGNVELLST